MPLMLVRTALVKEAMANPLKKKGLKKILERGRFKKKEIRVIGKSALNGGGAPKSVRRVVEKNPEDFGRAWGASEQRYPKLFKKMEKKVRKAQKKK